MYSRTRPGHGSNQMDTVGMALHKLRQALKRLRVHALRLNRVTVCTGVLVVLVFVCTTSSIDPMAPIINDVTTNLDDPVLFTQKANLNPYPESFKAQVKTGYPDLKSLEVAHSQDATFDACMAAAGKMDRWRIEHEDKAGGIIEGVAVTAILRFKDDWVIRVRGDSEKAVVDMRSKSRIGKGDLGANAARIKEYFSAVMAQLQ